MRQKVLALLLALLVVGNLPAASAADLSDEPAEGPAAAMDGAPADSTSPDGEAELFATTVSGTSGGTQWKLTPEGKLTIEPAATPETGYEKGVMADYSSYIPKRPWDKYLTGGVKLDAVEIKEGVTHIGNSAFQQATLWSAKLPSSLTSIGNDAFSGCETLENIQLPSGLESIGMYAFSSCKRLKCNIAIPSTCKSVGAYAFGNTAITGLTLPEGIETIGSGAFWSCKNLNIELQLPSTLTEVGNKAFCSSGITEVIVNSKRGASFGDSVFCSCENLETAEVRSIITIPNEMFLSCGKLKNITLAEGITFISYRAFGGCAIETIELPKSLITLGGGVFNGCAKLKSIVIPDKVWMMYGSTFYGCGALESVTLGDQMMTLEGIFDDPLPSIHHVTAHAGLKHITLSYRVKNFLKDTFGVVDKEHPVLQVTYYGTQAEWDEMCKRANKAGKNGRLTSATPDLRPVIHAALTWEHETVPVADAAEKGETVGIKVSRSDIDPSVPATAIAAVYDKDGKMLGSYTCVLDGDEASLKVKLPKGTDYIQLMMVNSNTWEPLYPAKIIR